MKAERRRQNEEERARKRKREKRHDKGRDEDTTIERRGIGGQKGEDNREDNEVDDERSGKNVLFFGGEGGRTGEDQGTCLNLLAHPHRLSLQQRQHRDAAYGGGGRK